MHLLEEGSLHNCQERKIELADGSIVTAAKEGSVRGIFKTSLGEYKILLKKVLYVPKMKVNLISVSVIQENGFSVVFRNDKCEVIRNSDNACTLGVPRIGRNYKAEFFPVENAFSASEDKVLPRSLWHNRLGHVSQKSIDLLSKGNCIKLSKAKGMIVTNCHTCLESKVPRRSFKTINIRDPTQKLELIHSDLCGPMQNNSLGKSKYFLIFVDDCTRMTFVSFLEKKSDCLSKFKEFYLRMKNQGYGKIKKLRTDNGTEYCNKDFRKFLSDNGIDHQLSAAYTPEQNGLAERTNRTLIEKAKCL